MFQGLFEATGELAVYGSNDDMLDDFLAEQKKHVVFTNIDPAGNYYQWHLFYLMLLNVSKEEEDGGIIYRGGYEAIEEPNFRKVCAVKKYTA
jgi:hypothetical protein